MDLNNLLWEEILKDNDTSLESKNIIKNFILIDRIDFNKYVENEKANKLSYSTGLEMWEMSNKLSAVEISDEINCTTTFRRFFANDRLNRSISIPDWFYIAYPDVERWFYNNKDEVLEEIAKNMDFYITNAKPNNNFFRFIIDKYKLITKQELECSL